jgi:hypothetical protein
MRVAQGPTQGGDVRSSLFVPDARSGSYLLESLSAPSGADGFGRIEHGLSTLLRTDAQTRRPTLEIPLPKSITAERLARVITGFLGNLTRPH